MAKHCRECGAELPDERLRIALSAEIIEKEEGLIHVFGIVFRVLPGDAAEERSWRSVNFIS